MLLGAISIIGIIFVMLGRWMFGKWFNHVSLYSAIWSVSLILFEWHLIGYYPLDQGTWLMILAGWLSFVFGSLTVVLARRATRKSEPVIGDSFSFHKTPAIQSEPALLRRALWVLNILTLLAALHGWYVLVQKFGSVSNVLIQGAILYTLRASEGIKGTIPYVSSLCLTATLLAGVYTAKVGRLRLVAVAPVVISILVNVSNMGRAMMIMAAILFCTGYFLTRRASTIVAQIKQTHRLRQFLMVLAVMALLVMGGEWVRSARHVNESITGASRTLQRLEGGSFITPTIYLYLTAHHGVFNQYLKHDDEKNFFGANTFAPLSRVLAKMGFDTYVNQYQRGYCIPVWSNTGTYLRELHADFGTLGVLVGPYLLGILTSFFWYRFVDTRRYVHLAILGYLQVITAMSLFFLVTIAGYLLVYLIGALLVGCFLDRKTEKFGGHLPFAISR